MCVVEKRREWAALFLILHTVHCTLPRVCAILPQREEKGEKERPSVGFFFLFGSPVVGVCVCEIGAPLFSFHLVVIRFTKELSERKKLDSLLVALTPPPPPPPPLSSSVWHCVRERANQKVLNDESNAAGLSVVA